ncbi:hypothetical protein MMC10_001424 [Thelotrema lepadinum]|nr:hypothetical protein [Thelotrema lepadinum]
MDEKTLQEWEQALCVLSNVPTEIRREIYDYTLIAERPIQLRKDGQLKALYWWKERSREANQQLKRASDFYLWADPTLDYKEVHDYLLSHNTFHVRNKVGADNFVKAIEVLSKAGFETTVHGLNILIDGSEVTQELADEGLRMHPNAKDYIGVARGCTAFGAYRMLKPLTRFDRLRNLHITLREARRGWPFFHIPFHDAYVVVPAVVAKLKELVLASSKTPTFKVTQQIAYGTKVAEENDISRMWNPRSSSKEQRNKHVEMFRDMEMFRDTGLEVVRDNYVLDRIQNETVDDEIYNQIENEMDDGEIYNESIRSDNDLLENDEPSYSDQEKEAVDWLYTLYRSSSSES